MGSSIEITPELMAGFLDEAPEYLEMLDAGLMELESKAGSGVLSLEDPEDQEQMNTMFRAAHSLKGLAAAFGFDKIKELTHRMETLFDQVRMRKRDLASASFETLFNVFDRLKALVGELADEPDTPVEIEDVLEALNRVLQDNGEAPSSAPVACEPAEEKGSREALLNNEVFSDPELKALFVETGLEAIDELNQGLLGLEENPTDADLMNGIFRAAHNIKGASGAAGLTGLNHFTHEMETVFDNLRNDKISLDEELMNALFQGVDRIRVVIDHIREGRFDDISAEDSRDRFTRWCPEAAAGAKTPEECPAPACDNVFGSDSTGDSADHKSDDGASFLPCDGLSEDSLQVVVTFPDGFDEATIQAYLIHNKLNDLGSVLSTDPDMEALAGDTPLTKVVYVMTSDDEPADIEEAVRRYSVEHVAVSRGGETTDSATEQEKEEKVEREASAHLESNVSSAQSPATPSASVAPAVTASVSSSSTSPAGATGTVGGKGLSSAPNKKLSKPATAPKKKAAPSGSSSSPQPPARTPGSKGEKRVVKTGETLRVDQERLDELMNLGGELIINRARFTDIHSRFREVFDGKNLGFLVDDMTERFARMEECADNLYHSAGRSAETEGLHSDLKQLGQSFEVIRGLVQRVHQLRTSMFDFDEALHSLTRVSDGIQKGIMGTRMVPVGPLFTRFRRVVRDISKSTGKQVDLVLRGETTELDKRMIDELGDPLTHMVRNSIDHGIEVPEERIAAGKDPKGTLILEACHRGNSICIEVTDDGAGINLERVKQKALERELVTETQLERMSDRDIAQFVLKPGFSTAQVVTDLSGRGMGMDIVMAKLEKLNGTIELDSTPGQGTKVVIKLPLTLAILTSMVARIGKGIYAIPLEAVAEIITVRKEAIQRIQRRQVARVRERVVPIARYESIFDTPLAGLQTESQDGNDLTLVIIGFENEQIGLVVDELLGQQDVVIKSLAENYKNVKGFAGASIRGDGSVSLILDVPAVIEMAAKAATDVQPPAPVPVTDPVPVTER